MHIVAFFLISSRISSNDTLALVSLSTHLQICTRSSSSHECISDFLSISHVIFRPVVCIIALLFPLCCSCHAIVSLLKIEFHTLNRTGVHSIRVKRLWAIELSVGNKCQVVIAIVVLKMPIYNCKCSCVTFDKMEGDSSSLSLSNSLFLHFFDTKPHTPTQRHSHAANNNFAQPTL